MKGKEVTMSVTRTSCILAMILPMTVAAPAAAQDGQDHSSGTVDTPAFSMASGYAILQEEPSGPRLGGWFASVERDKESLVQLRCRGQRPLLVV
jgi:hypothetical protein